MIKENIRVKKDPPVKQVNLLSNSIVENNKIQANY